jgi:hypothetical protein
LRTFIMRRISPALLSASLVATGFAGCSDDDDGDKGKADVGVTPGTDAGKSDAGTSMDGGGTLLDASLDATTGDAGNPAVVAVSSKAADLRVTINLLLGEHLILAAKATGAALGARSNEFSAYGAALNKNGTDLGDLVGAAYGDAAKSAFNGIWSAHNGFFVDYTTGVATSDEPKKTKAVSDLTSTYVPQFSQLIASATGLPLPTVTTLVTAHVTTTKAIVDAQGAKNWPATYTAVRTAFAHMQMLGDPLAKSAAATLKYAGDIEAKSVGFRVALNQLLQEHLYLASMATDAAIQGRAADEFPAANSALSANGTDLGAALNGLYGASVETAFNAVWSAHNGYFVDYTLGVATPDAARATTAVSNLTTKYVPDFSALLQQATDVPAASWTQGVTEHVLTTKAVVDAQYLAQTTPSAANSTSVVEKDLAAGKHMEMLGNPLAIAIVTKLPAKF